LPHTATTNIPGAGTRTSARTPARTLRSASNLPDISSSAAVALPAATVTPSVVPLLERENEFGSRERARGVMGPAAVWTLLNENTQSVNPGVL
jgi:hypothetical protein